MDFYQIKGLKKRIINTIFEVYKDDEIICPFCNKFVNKKYIGEFENKKNGYKSVECNHCSKFSGVKYITE